MPPLLVKHTGGTVPPVPCPALSGEAIDLSLAGGEELGEPVHLDDPTSIHWTRVLL